MGISEHRRHGIRIPRQWQACKNSIFQKHQTRPSVAGFGVFMNFSGAPLYRFFRQCHVEYRKGIAFAVFLHPRIGGLHGKHRRKLATIRTFGLYDFQRVFQAGILGKVFQCLAHFLAALLAAFAADAHVNNAVRRVEFAHGLVGKTPPHPLPAREGLCSPLGRRGAGGEVFPTKP